MFRIDDIDLNNNYWQTFEKHAFSQPQRQVLLLGTACTEDDLRNAVQAEAIFACETFEGITP